MVIIFNDVICPYYFIFIDLIYFLISMQYKAIFIPVLHIHVHVCCLLFSKFKIEKMVR